MDRKPEETLGGALMIEILVEFRTRDVNKGFRVDNVIPVFK
jgi:hypothetical protein